MDPIIQSVITSYGPIGFGLASVLIIWKTIVEPFLKHNRVDSERMDTAASAMTAAANLNKETVVALNETARILRESISELNKLRKSLHEEVGH